MNIKSMASKVEKTEQTVRREEKALAEGRPVEVWREWKDVAGEGGS